MYNGGKNVSGTYQRIINIIPPHSVYSEWFCGSGGIYHNKKAAHISILFDVDPAIHQFYNFSNQSGNILLITDVISNIELISTFFSILQLLGQKVFVYLDPPYPMSSRSSQKNIYNFEMSDQQHVTLLKAITKCNFPIAINTYKNQLYSDFLSNWNFIRYKSTTRNGSKYELLYFNYPWPTVLHDYSFIGENFRERDLIKKQIDNFVSKFQNFSPFVKAAIQSKLNGQVKV